MENYLSHNEWLLEPRLINNVGLDVMTATGTDAALMESEYQFFSLLRNFLSSNQASLEEGFYTNQLDYSTFEKGAALGTVGAEVYTVSRYRSVAAAVAKTGGTQSGIMKFVKIGGNLINGIIALPESGGRIIDRFDEVLEVSRLTGK